MLAVDEEIKYSNLRYSHLIPFRVSRVSDAHFRGFAPEPTLLRLQLWRVIGNVWEILSFRNLNPIFPAPKENVLPFAQLRS